jgi:PAS domain S-box-containing protein
MQLESKVNILLVDDQPNNLLVLEALLEPLNQNVVKALSGQEALRYLLQEEFAVILLDVQMPDLNGFELAKLIRQRPALQDIPIIFLTAINHEDFYVLRGYALGAVDYLVKPIEPEILLTKVKVFICLFQKTQEVKRQAAQLVAINQQLQQEIRDHQQAEDALRRISDQLESKVEERTAELLSTNELLLTEIVERKRIEVALRESEERFRVALKNSPTIVFSQDTELRYLWIYNPVYDYAAQDFVGKLDSDLILPEEAQQLTVLKQQVLNTGVGMRQEVSVTLGGRLRYYDLTIEPLRDRRGELEGIICAAIDITAIRTREIQFSAIFENVLEGIVIADDEGYLVKVNSASSQLFSLPCEALLGKSIAEFMEPGFDFSLAWSTFLQQGQAKGELCLVHLDGTIREVEYSAKANFLPGRHLSVLRDITERNQVQKALQESQRFIEKITNTIPILVYVFNLNPFCNVYLNRYGQEFLGYTQEEIKAKGFQLFAEVLHPDDIPKLRELPSRCAQVKDTQILENEIRLKNAQGEWRWFHTWDIVFTRTDEGLPEQVLGTAIDITQEKQTEEIRASLEAEKELRKLQLRFFSMTSHEFRTPLSSILAGVQLLETFAHNWPEEKRRRNLQRIKAAAKQMNRLLDDILTINRAETGKLEINPQPIQLEPFCQNLVEEIQFSAGKQHTIQFVNQGQFQSLCLDDKLLRSILINLLSNAVKYSPEGGKIAFTLRSEPNAIIFQIEDQGIGIPLEDQKHLFEPFHRGRNVGNISGTGLGITVVKKCLDLQKGQISVQSEEGVGTTVTISIPVSANVEAKTQVMEI